MQQQIRRRRTSPGFWLRVLLVLAWMTAAMALPITVARACSCALGDVSQAAARAEVAFVGTVLDHRQTDVVGEMEGPLVEYAFRVERATAQTPEITLVRVSGSDAACGVTFGVGEDWLVIIPPRSDRGDMASDTHLCAGNTRVADLQPHDIADVEALLTVEPVPAPPEPASGQLPLLVPILAAVAGGAVLVAGVLVARRARG